MTVNKLNYAHSYLIAPIKPPLAFISSQLFLKYSLKVIRVGVKLDISLRKPYSTRSKKG